VDAVYLRHGTGKCRARLGHGSCDPADKLAAAKARRDRGESPTQIAKALGVSRASVYRHLG
jgi:DNA invertase Pin-like site-specific DNA recombinase